MKKIKLSDEQRFQLERLWFIYGNHGPKRTHAGHRFIQCFLEQGKDHRKFFKPDQEVINEVDKILNM